MCEHFHDIFRTFSDFLPFSDLVSFRVQSARSLRSGLKERPTEGGTCRRITGRVEEIYKFVHFCTKCFCCFRCVQSVLPGTPVKASCGRAKSLQTRHGLRMQIVAHKAFSIEISHLPEIWGCRKQWRAISFLQLSCRAYAKQRKQRQWFWNQARWDFVHQSAKIWKKSEKTCIFFFDTEEFQNWQVGFQVFVPRQRLRLHSDSQGFTQQTQRDWVSQVSR